MKTYLLEERDAATGEVLHATDRGYDGPLTTLDAARDQFARELRLHPGRYDLGAPYRLALVAPTETETETGTDCVRCHTTSASAVCCSSHNKHLCHLCYRRTHFVDRCVEGCTECAAENLPVRLSDLAATR